MTARAGSAWVTRETMIFPRYHQLDAVRKLVAGARQDGPGSNFLIQHSAGSGQNEQHLLAVPSSGQPAHAAGP